MRSEICFLCIMFELLSLLRDRHCRRCAPLNGMEGRSARRPTNAGSWCGLQPYFSVSSFTYVRVKCVASLPSCPENHDEIAASYAAVVAKAAAARRRRRLRDRAPSFALSSASTSAYCDGDETTATAAWFFAAERIIDGPARNEKQRSTGTKSMTRACMRLPTYTWGYATIVRTTDVHILDARVKVGALGDGGLECVQVDDDEVCARERRRWHSARIENARLPSPACTTTHRSG